MITTTRWVALLRGVNVNGVKVTSAALRERFGYEAFVVVLSADALRGVHDGYLFEREDAGHHPYVVFSSDADVLTEVAGRAGEGAGVEQLRLAGDVLYWRCPKGSSTETPFARLVAGARYKPFLTTRNLRTLGEVLAAAED